MIDLGAYRGQVFGVMGLGRSGRAAARALTAGGATALCWDDVAEAREAATGCQLADLYHTDLSGLAGIIWSPGVPHTLPRAHALAEKARAAGIPLLCDIELLARAEAGKRLVGVTGTNGKSTTTALIAHILQAAGIDARAGGNIGEAALALAPVGADGVYVLELSSYQLELLDRARFDVAILLNISRDHIDRHGDMAGYARAKRRIFEGGADLSPPGTAIIGLDDGWSRRIYSEIAGMGRQPVIGLSVERQVPDAILALDGKLIDSAGGQMVELFDMKGAPALPGRHNWQNAAAAFAACRALGVPAEKIAAGLAGFPGLAHRQQLVRRIGKVAYVNDSKATNAVSAAKALACYDSIYWILGGKPKEGGLDGLESLLGPVRHAFLIGEAEAQFANWLEGRVPHTLCGAMAEAVKLAHARAQAEAGSSGATVLLSPACASFDQYPNFEARGADFMARVEALSDPAAREGAA